MTSSTTDRGVQNISYRKNTNTRNFVVTISGCCWSLFYFSVVVRLSTKRFRLLFCLIFWWNEILFLFKMIVTSRLITGFVTITPMVPSVEQQLPTFTGNLISLPFFACFNWVRIIHVVKLHRWCDVHVSLVEQERLTLRKTWYDC